MESVPIFNNVLTLRPAIFRCRKYSFNYTELIFDIRRIYKVWNEVKMLRVHFKIIF